MTTEADIEAFLLNDVAAALGAAWSVYVGHAERINPAARDVQIHHERPEPVRRDVGWLRHHVTLYLRCYGWDDGAEGSLAAVLDAARDTLVARYDGKRAIWAAALPTKTVVRARATRLEDIDADATRRRREGRVRLQVDEFLRT